ncbi:3-oxoacyl-ACP synthase [Puniceibacterium sp. IMCC21224]|nr:3-oxoacyl-ACP synthase [Puniceibacterium sp. IMCC21224]
MIGYIHGTGMCTPVGCSAAASCAAIRCGLDGYVQSADLFDRWGAPLTTAPLPLFEKALPEADLLLSNVLNEAAQDSGLQRVERASITFLAPLAGRHPSRFGGNKVNDFSDRLRKSRPSVNIEVSETGPAGLGLILKRLQNVIRIDPDTPRFIVGLDSLLSLDIIESLEQEDRVRDTTRPRGLIPGEACGAIVLTGRSTSRQSLAVLGCGTATEPGTLFGDIPNVSEGYTSAVMTALDESGLQASDIASVYIDLNGEEGKFHEWGLLWSRLFEELTIVHPADCIGDVGAATMPILVGLADMAWRKGYASGPYAAVIAGSDDGLRSCVILGKEGSA